MNATFNIPQGYKSNPNVKETEIAIKDVKDYFERALAKKLSLTRVSAPLMVRSDSGLNDNLNGVERAVSFDIKEGGNAEIVHSLAKWKRMALGKYDFKCGEGLYTDMNAIRRDEDTDNIHSIYVDQWDWEKIISKEDRTEEYLRKIVEDIYEVFKNTEIFINSRYPEIKEILPENISFITSQELEDLYPKFSPKEREQAYAKQKGAIFIEKIGGKLASGKPHDGRAPDYDDWDLNGDILFYDELLGQSIELSSMGIRVSEESLMKQLKISGYEERKKLPFQKALLNGELPYTIGGGIGQSRICMFFLRKAHIGEVQASVWPKETLKYAQENDIIFL